MLMLIVAWPTACIVVAARPIHFRLAGSSESTDDASLTPFRLAPATGPFAVPSAPSRPALATISECYFLRKMENAHSLQLDGHVPPPPHTPDIGLRIEPVEPESWENVWVRVHEAWWTLGPWERHVVACLLGASPRSFPFVRVPPQADTRLPSGCGLVFLVQLIMAFITEIIAISYDVQVQNDATNEWPVEKPVGEKEALVQGNATESKNERLSCG